jgi:hypothetical protein
MTFQETLVKAISAPFNPNKVFKGFGTEENMTGSNVTYMLFAEIFWYVGLLMLFPFRYMEFFNFFSILSFLVPIIFSTFGLTIALQAVSNFTLKDRLSWKFSIGLVTFSYIPVLLSVLLGALIPSLSLMIHYGSLIWVSATIGFAIKHIRGEDIFKGVATGIIAVILVTIASRIFYRYFFLSIM